MNILVINAGSSSIKFQLIEMPKETILCKGIVDKVGFKDAIFSYEIDRQKYHEVLEIKDHAFGIHKIATIVRQGFDIDAVGHRVVHGGPLFKETTLINETVKSSIAELASLAPLHNPPNLLGIEVSETVFPNARQIAVFDTAFHQTISQEAFQYAIPNQFLTEHHIRVYGFHGTSHKYVTEKANEFLNKKDTNLISIHLGNGSSISAVKNGECIDTSLGFGPVNGLVMGTRSGDIDQSVIFYMYEKLGLSLERISKILQKESGLKGLTGFSDLREIEKEANNGNSDCINALKIMSRRIKKYIGAYVSILNGLDAIIFTAGIGENSEIVRKMVCENLEYLGINLDRNKNQLRSDQAFEIQKDTSKVKILVIPTNEEIEIAKQCYELLQE